MKVLVVDDILFARKLLSDKLIKMGYDVLEAVNGEDAVNKTKSERPDLVLMDLVMPKMDGITATQMITRETKTRVVICTALGDRSHVIAAVKAGASDYLIKPFEELRLESSIKKCTPVAF